MYLFDNELFAIECMAKYAVEGLNVNYRGVHDGRRDEFAHCPTPRSMGNWAYYLTFNDHQHQGLLQSKDMDRKCFVPYKTKLWLDTYPPNYFELYDIYDEFNSGKHHSQFGVIRSKEYREKQSKILSDLGRTGTLSPMYGRTGALSNRSKAVIVIKPDGTKLHFGSAIEAAKELKTTSGNISIHIKNNRPALWGRFKNWQFFEDNGVPGEEVRSRYHSKPIIVIKPDGTKLHFVGISEAARVLGMKVANMSKRYLKTGKSPTKGKFKDYQFFYAE